jgi:hypothetical protein
MQTQFDNILCIKIILSLLTGEKRFKPKTQSFSLFYASIDLKRLMHVQLYFLGGKWDQAMWESEYLI